MSIDDNKQRENLPQNPPKAEGATMPFRTQTAPSNPSSQIPRRRKRRKRVERKGKLYAFCYVLITLVICVTISYFSLTGVNDVLAFSKPDKAVEVTIPDKATTDEIADILKEKGLIKYTWAFSFISKYEEYDGKYQGGRYTLNTNMGYTSMMKAMEKQTSSKETVRVTIPEGLPLNKIAAILQENKVCSADDFMQRVNNTEFSYDYVKQIPSDSKIFYKMEGYLFPDTYEFYKNENTLSVISKMMKNFENKITPQIQALMKKRGLSLHETITLASIIQGEAPNFEEMKRVSSVYNNRLNDKATFPKLQADPTRDYANEQVLAHIGDRDKAIAEAYNTYTGIGLPPGPINCPGIDAIQAALEPEDTSYYYFCTNLKTKEFFYAETLDEHNVNLKKAGLR